MTKTTRPLVGVWIAPNGNITIISPDETIAELLVQLKLTAVKPKEDK